ncbi:cupin domain-containing protein [Nocardioides xinjiangensis]|uniref:cupin domain-containing protein n=1 Tax=Nocardioides xinjiangensis TaxID=2817376 RepID=UPI001B3071C7|nr:cupin domain-containing protein [Nocardioides sp. SYSU D00778]
MSYPPPIYHGDSGEVSARVTPADVEPAVVYPNGNKVFYLAQGTETAGTFGLYRWEFAGPASGPGAHFHRTITESFYVLEGTVTIFDGRDWVKCRAGDFAHVPAGGIHGFRNEDGAATMLLHFAPGAPREAYFEGLAAGMGNLDGDAYDRFMREHDNTWV